MGNTVLLNNLNEKLSSIDVGKDSIVVLKGIPVSIVDPEIGTISLDEVIADKFAYFMNVYGKRKFIAYEEYLLLYSFIDSQYKRVYILNNNMYLEQYPVEECFTDEIRRNLLNHFGESDSVSEDAVIGRIDEYTTLYVGLKEYNGYLIGAYNDPDKFPQSEVIEIDVFDSQNGFVVSEKASEDADCNLITESDYLDFVKRLFSEPDELRVRISDYIGDKEQLRNQISLVAWYWKDYTDIICFDAKSIDAQFESRPEFSEILKQYWGYPSFQDLSFYDMTLLEKGEKKIIKVSQEQIISNLVQEVENCANSGRHRDLFVTAPTGAGKSIMFQLPAIYLAEKYRLLTIVISPLIGLMNDQIKGLELKNYSHAKTINSDISPIVKKDIIEKVGNNELDILYLSPETLLSRSDVEQLIGDRTIGMIIIDEAHIVTTWGKQFRPDYWYLGDHIRKLRKRQLDQKERSFVIATYTATAIYHGFEDMYTETINSLNMLSPITYLGYIKRDDIDIVIDRSKKGREERTEYELDKFDQILAVIERARITDKKTLIYFPTIKLIDRCYDYLSRMGKAKDIAFYHGSLDKEKKQANYEAFYNKEKLVMLATKAFGMGIDINDIELVIHFAPTGNVCDYVQEIGRAARRKDLRGEAFYHYNSRDFQHINRLHGLSTIRPYQLVQVVEKIVELYQNNLKNKGKEDFTRKRNTMLLDAENFSYIFSNSYSDEDNIINKVKTALLLIQKNFEIITGFPAIAVRPIPMFSTGFFSVAPAIQRKVLSTYPRTLTEIDKEKHICKVQLDKIWDTKYRSYSFPQFKYMLYSKNQELPIVKECPMNPAFCIKIDFAKNYKKTFADVWYTIRDYIIEHVQKSDYISCNDIADELTRKAKLKPFQSESICEVILASMEAYRKDFAKSSVPMMNVRPTNSGITKYRFNVAVNSFFSWVHNGFDMIERGIDNGRLYVIDDNGKKSREYSTILGVLESIGCLSFEMLGGANSQIYIYINSVQALKKIVNSPGRYHNKLLDMVADRHLVSVKMLTYLYENDFNSDEIWNLIEDYFLGSIPQEVIKACKDEKPDILL